MFGKILDKAVLIALIAQIGFILYMNLFHADTIIDYDSSSAYMHEIEMGSQGKIFPAEYSYQGSLDLDSGALISAAIYRVTGNIFLSRGITNILMVFLYIYVVGCVLGNSVISLRWKRFGILLFLIPYSMIMLGYWRMLFTGGGLFAVRALMPILIISLLQDIDKGKEFKRYAFRAALLLLMVFLCGLSSGAYVLLCAVCPLILWESVKFFFKADHSKLKSKRMVLAATASASAIAGIAVQKGLGFSTIADQKHLITSDKFISNLFDCFAGIFELFGGLTIHENVSLFSAEGIGTAVNFFVTCILLSAVIYSIVKCIKKKEIPEMYGYIFSVMLVNVLMFAFADLKYGETVYESRYHLLPMLPAFFLLAGMLEDQTQSRRLKSVQINALQLLIALLFAASLLYGDAQWVYAKTALGTEKLKELNSIMEDEAVKTAFIVGDDNKVLGRKLRVYSRDVHYIVLSDGAESAWQTAFGGTTRYLDNSMQQGKTAVIASAEAYKTLPAYLVKDMSYLTAYDGLDIYVSDTGHFDCEGGISAGKDRIVDFPYSPGYVFDGADLCDDGTLKMSAGGGHLCSTYGSSDGTWIYTVYYDMPEPPVDQEGGSFEIKVGDDDPAVVRLDPDAAFVNSGEISMTAGKTVSFSLTAPEDTVIERIEISRKK